MIAWLEKQGEKLPAGFYYVNSEGKKFYSDTFKYGDITLHVEKQDQQKPFADSLKFANGEIGRLVEENYHLKERVKELEKRGENENKITFTFSDILALECSMKTAKITKGGDELYKILVPLYNKIHNAYLLERQDKQKSVNKVEPKFKVGDWIVFNGFTLLINEVVQGYYRTISIDGLHNSYDWNIDNMARLWTIKEAKSGDVLANDHHILILKEPVYDWYTNGTPYSIKAYCGIKPNGNFEIGKDNWSFCGTLHIHPATKEQHETLMKAMVDAGYTFDFETKELKKIHIIDEGKSEMDYCFTKMMNGEKVSPTWSEEDEHRTKDTIYFLETAKKHYASTIELDACIDWLKSIKQKLEGEK